MTATNGSARLDSLKHDVAALLDTSKLQNVLLSLFEDLVKQGDRIQVVDENHQKLFSYCKEGVEMLDERIQKSVEMLDERIHKIDGQIGEKGLRGALTAVETRLAAMDEEVQGRLIAVECKIAQTMELLESEIEARFAKLENKTGLIDALEREVEERFMSLESKFQRADEAAAARHNQVKEQFYDFQLSQAWRIEEVAKEKTKAETEAAEARRFAFEAEEAVAVERQRRLKEREDQLEKDRLADEAAVAERQRRRAEREAQLEKERFAEEAAAAERRRQREEREAELGRELAEERLAEEYAAAQRQRKDRRSPRPENTYPLDKVMPVNELLELARCKPAMLKEERSFDTQQLMNVELIRQAPRPQPQQLQKPIIRSRSPTPQPQQVQQTQQLQAISRLPSLSSPLGSPYGSASVLIPARLEQSVEITDVARKIAGARNIQPERPDDDTYTARYAEGATIMREPQSEIVQLQNIERIQEVPFGLKREVPVIGQVPQNEVKFLSATHGHVVQNELPKGWVRRLS